MARVKQIRPTADNKPDWARDVALVINAHSQILNRVTLGTAAPTVGAWEQSDIIINTAPTAGGNIGWVCVTSGSPGTWKTFGTIAP